MIEVIYKEEKTVAEEEGSSFSVPRNIRQVGLIGEKVRIYLEDYVYTFLKRLSEKRGADDLDGRLAILKGETHWKGGITYLFVRGAVLAPTENLSADNLSLSGEDWKQIQEEEEKYFPSEETVGWYFTEPGLRLQMTPGFDSLHLKYFGADKVCMLMDPLEKEEAFFRYENNNLIRQSGYYLYYEKNQEMQAYMIEKKQELADLPGENTKDEAVKTFRQKITETEETNAGKTVPFHTELLNYAATACLVLTVLTAGFHFYQNYRKLEEQAPFPVPDVPSSTLSEPAVETSSVSEALFETKTQEEPAEEEKKENTEKAGKTAADQKESAEDPGKKTAEQIESDERPENLEENLEEAENTSEAPAENSEKTSSVPMHPSYVIRPGDTLFQICLDHYGSLDRMAKLCELNGISENDVIYPGEIIVLP